MMRARLALLGGFVLAASAMTMAQPGGFGQPGGGFGPPGGGFPGGTTRKILKDYDKNNDGWLNTEERKEARAAIQKGGGGFRPKGGGFGPGGGRNEAPKPGATIKVEDAKVYGSDIKLYDPTVMRTIFFEFENKDWEKELEEFHGTDVDVAAKMIVDGKTYNNVGIHFRGMSSYMGVGTGSKRSLNVSVDMADSKQRLYGYKSLNLLNGHDDSTFLNTIMYSHIARQYIPTPNANAVRVVINGENWGVYTNVQQFDKVFLNENFKTTKGTRWKVRGSPGGRGGLEYLGDKIEDYKRIFEMKTGDGTDEKAWKALINLCKVINTTPADKLEEALKPILDIDGVLWFLALDNALINCDGYWIRASDYSIYLDEKGKFHVIPHDMNECFRTPQGPGMGGGGPGGGGRGPGGPGGGGRFGPPSPGTIMPEPIVEMLGLTADQKKELEKLQKETNEKLAKLLTKEQQKQLDEMKNNIISFGPPGGGMGPGGGGIGAVRDVELDPLVGLTETRKPLRSKLLAVPNLKAKYLENVRTIAEKQLDWKYLGPVVAQYRKLLDTEVKADTKKLSSYEAFTSTTADDATTSRGRDMPLRAFADQRRTYLLKVTDPKSDNK